MSGLGLRVLLSFPQILLIFGERQFGIFQEVVVGGALTKAVGRPVFHHETVQFVALEVGHFQHHRGVEAVVDILIFFVFEKPALERFEASRPVELEIADDLIEVEAGAHAQTGAAVGDGKGVRFFEVEIFFVVFPVLERVVVIAPGHDPYFFQFGRVDMEGDVEAALAVDIFDGIFDGRATEIGEKDGIGVGNGDLVVAGRVGDRAPPRSAHDADPVERTGPIHIIYGAVNGDLGPDGVSNANNNKDQQQPPGKK